MRYLLVMFVGCTLALAFSGASATPENVSALEKFRTATAVSQRLCALSAEHALLKAEIERAEKAVTANAYEEIGACIARAKVDAKGAYAKGLAAVARKPAAARLLKDYYAAWLASLQSLAPDTSDTKSTWDRRQAEAARRTDEIWTRFEVEAGL